MRRGRVASVLCGLFLAQASAGLAQERPPAAAEVLRRYPKSETNASARRLGELERARPPVNRGSLSAAAAVAARRA